MITDKNASELIKQYGFCTVETHLALQKAGFFDKVRPRICLVLERKTYTGEKLKVGFLNSYINEHNNKSVNRLHSEGMDCYTVLAMPQFDEVWAALPYKIPTNGFAFKAMDNLVIGYKTLELSAIHNGKFVYTKIIDDNITDTACRLWLKLKELGLLS